MITAPKSLTAFQRPRIKAVFFDLDGTLLPLDMEAFLKLYYGAIRESGFYERISPENGGEIFAAGVRAMLGNDGSALNSEVFFSTIERMSGVCAGELIPHMNDFYTGAFRRVKGCTHADKRVPLVIEELKRKGIRRILATNPLFPKVATDQRIEWAGLCPGDFEYVSYYDNSRFCKPNKGFFLEILEKRSLKACECCIVGNDVAEDMGALDLGFSGFLVLDHLIGDMERVTCERGGYLELLDFARSLAH